MRTTNCTKPGLRKTTPPAALAFAIATAEQHMTVGASTRRLAHLAKARIASVERDSRELMALLNAEVGS